MTERRSKPRPVSTLRRILDITFAAIRKTEAKYGPMDKQEKPNVQTDASNSN